MRRRLGEWREVETMSSDLLHVMLWRYSAEIVKPWRVTAHIIRRAQPRWLVRTFDNVYFTEAKARRAFGDIERLTLIRLALEALGL